jgi:hypothetical protein
MIELNCVPIIVNFKIISNARNDSKFNISTTLGLKLKKSCPRIPTHQVHSNNTKSLPNFPKILVLILLNFLWQNCSIFDNSCTVIFKTMKPKWYQDDNGGIVVWEIRIWETKNIYILLSLIDRFYGCIEFWPYIYFDWKCEEWWRKEGGCVWLKKYRARSLQLLFLKNFTSTNISRPDHIPNNENHFWHPPNHYK